MSRRRLLREVDSHELSEWEAYDRLEPIGPQRLELGLAIVASQIFNANRGKNQEPLNAADFMNDYAKPWRDHFGDDVEIEADRLVALERKLDAAFARMQ